MRWWCSSSNRRARNSFTTCIARNSVSASSRPICGHEHEPRLVESTENKMNKTMAIAGAAVLAASVFALSAPTPGPRRQGHQDRWRTPSPSPSLAPPPSSSPRSTSSDGREARAAGQAGAGGRGRPCATPTVSAASTTPPAACGTTARTTAGPASSPWTFKSGSWFYGSSRWYPSNGTWLTNAAEAPAPIDCKSSPAFAAKADGQKELGGYAHQGELTEPGRAPIASAKVEPTGPQTTNAASGACKKYFPNLGEMLPVPCTN